MFLTEAGLWARESTAPAQGNQSLSRELRASALCPGLEARFPARRREERGCGPGVLPNPEIEPRSPALQADSLPSGPPGKPKNTGVGSLSLLQGIFPTQRLNPGLPHCRQVLYQLSHKGSPLWVTNLTLAGRQRVAAHHREGEADCNIVVYSKKHIFHFHSHSLEFPKC